MTEIPKLNPYTFEILLGRQMHSMEIFDYTNEKFMSRFIGIRNSFTTFDMKNIWDFRNNVESLPYMANHKLVAVVLSMTSDDCFKSWDFCAKNPRVVANPNAIANIITFEMEPGHFGSNPCGWFGYGSKDSYVCLEQAEQNAMKDFTRWMNGDPKMLQKFLSGYKNRKGLDVFTPSVCGIIGR